MDERCGQSHRGGKGQWFQDLSGLDAARSHHATPMAVLQWAQEVMSGQWLWDGL